MLLLILDIGTAPRYRLYVTLMNASLCGDINEAGQTGRYCGFFATT